MPDSEGNSSTGHTAVLCTFSYPASRACCSSTTHEGNCTGTEPTPAPDPDQAHKEQAAAFPSSQEIHACKQTIFSPQSKQGKLESKNHFVSVTVTVTCISICKTNKTLSGNSEKNGWYLCCDNHHINAFHSLRLQCKWQLKKDKSAHVYFFS